MKVDPAIVGRFMEQAAIEQLSGELEAQGYKVERDVALGSARADLVARGDDGSLTVFEVKVPAPGNASSWAKQASVLREQARALGGRFQLVLVRRPRETRVEIDGLESAIQQELNENTPPALKALSASTSVEGVSSLDITSLSMRDETTEVEGDAVVSAILHSSTGEAVMQDSFPIHFKAALDRANRVISFDYDVDTSNWD